MLLERWIPEDPGRSANVLEGRVWLRRDVSAGETLMQNVLLIAPPEPGSYVLELRVDQVDGARFDGPGNVVYRQPVRVVPATAPSASTPDDTAGSAADDPASPGA
jgi:hypothetical protein